MNFKTNYSIFILIIFIISVIAGYINYNYLSPIDIPLSFTSSNIISLPSSEQENTFIFTTKGLKEWSSLKDIESSASLKNKESPTKAENFDIKFNPDISAYMRNYYSLQVIQSKILLPMGTKTDPNIEKSLFVVNPLGNGKIIIEKNFETNEKAMLFSKLLKEEQFNLVNDLNKTRNPNSLLPANLENVVFITENQRVIKKTLIQFLAGFVVVFSILFYIVTTLKNNHK